MQVEFGHHDEQFEARPHGHLRRRQDSLDALDAAAPSSTTAPAVSGIALSSATVSSSVVGTLTNIAFPTVPDTSMPAATSVANDISYQITDTRILPSNESVLADAEGLVLPPGVTLQCTNCTIGGTVDFLAGSFSVGNSSSSSNDSVIDFILDGYVEVVTHDLFAHLELDTTWVPAAGATFSVTLATLPLHPFSIPDIAVIGVMFSPKLEIGVEISTQLNFSYGFELTVPDGASAMVNLGSPTNSSITGFDKTDINMLPFQASTDGIALTLSTTLVPEILLGYSFLNGIAAAGAGIFLNLPHLSLEIAQVSGTNDRCEPLANSTTANHDFVDELLGNLTHIVPQLEIAGGLIAQMNLGSNGEQTAWTPLATAFTGPTACLAFDSGGSSYVPATALAAVTSSADGAASGSTTATATQNGGPVTVLNPFVEGGSRYVGWQLAALLLAVVSGGFAIAL
ncbi:hypothetical protein MMC24_004663 [Lignoscripta atroalba]|nr:hypothetical protein [Lignoscripta atroalba]